MARGSPIGADWRRLPATQLTEARFGFPADWPALRGAVAAAAGWYQRLFYQAQFRRKGAADAVLGWPGERLSGDLNKRDNVYYVKL